MSDVTVKVDEHGNLHLPPRVIPLPTSVSQDARRFLSSPRLAPPSVPGPTGDAVAWRRYIAEIEEAMEPRIQMMLDGCAGRSTVETKVISNVTVHVATPVEMPPDRVNWARITVHGGAFVLLGGRYAAAEAALAAAETQCMVFGVDYRRPPDHPYPAAVDDVVAVYRALLDEYSPEKVAVSGASAGGNIAAAATLKARDMGLPLPGCLLLMTPTCDLTRSGDSWATNHMVDNVQPEVRKEFDLIYAGGADMSHPHLSPIYGDFTRGFPPSYISTGTRDLFLSNSVLMHRALRRAAVEAELHVWDAAPHGNFPSGPERDDQNREELEFIARNLSKPLL